MIVLTNYVRRCKAKKGFDTHFRLHGADNTTTLCGKELSEMWFVESSAGLSEDDISCPQCRRIIHEQKV